MKLLFSLILPKAGAYQERQWIFSIIVLTSNGTHTSLVLSSEVGVV